MYNNAANLNPLKWILIIYLYYFTSIDINMKHSYNAPSTCGMCGQTYTRSSSLKEHYDTKNIRKRGKMVPNPWYSETRLAV